MKRRGFWITHGLLAVMLVAGAGFVHVVAAQAKTTTKTKTARKKKAPARRVVRRRAQRAPTRARIIEIQKALAREGFYKRKPSGRWDATTRRAMKEFQSSKGLTPTGKLGALSLQKLGLGSKIAGLGAPLPQADTRPSAMSESELNEPVPDEPDTDEPEATEP